MHHDARLLSSAGRRGPFSTSSWTAGGFMKSPVPKRARCCCHLCRSWASRLASPFPAWPAVQRAARVRSSQRAGCETASRYHVGSRVRRGQPLGAEVLLVVPTAGRKRFAVSSLDCSHARTLSTLPRPTRTSIGTAVTGLKSTKNEPTAQHTPQSKPVRLDCLTVRYVRSEEQPCIRHPRLRVGTPCCDSRGSSAEVGETARRVETRARL